MRFLSSILCAAVLFAAGTAPLRADPRAAQDIAYRMAGSYVAQGFALAPPDKSGMLKTGQSVRFLVPVSKGLDYVFLVGGDDAALDLDVYVYDEVGGLILADRRPSKYAGVQLHSSYSGSVVVYVHMVKAEGSGSYSLLVGRKSATKEDAPAPPEAAPSAAPNKDGAPATDVDKKP
jgi:hypothetical protein